MKLHNLELELIKHTSDIYSFFKCYCKLDQSQAEDLTQKAFIECWRGLSKFRQKSSLKTWSLTICRRIFSKHIKAKEKEKKEARTLNELSPEEGKFIEKMYKSKTPEELYLKKESLGIKKVSLEQVWKEVRNLNPIYQEVFYLKYSEGLTNKEIAEVIGKEIGTVKTRLKRGLKTIQISLGV